MSYEITRRSVTPPRSWIGRSEELSRKLSESIRGVLRGETNNHFVVTLDASSDCTEVEYSTSRPGLSVLITPQNQDAAEFSRTNNVWGESSNGTVKVCHDATAAGTERYGVVIVG